MISIQLGDYRIERLLGRGQVRSDVVLVFEREEVADPRRPAPGVHEPRRGGQVGKENDAKAATEGRGGEKEDITRQDGSTEEDIAQDRQSKDVGSQGSAAEVGRAQRDRPPGQVERDRQEKNGGACECNAAAAC